MSYRDLIAWKKGMQLANSVYDATDLFPLAEIETQILIAQNRGYFQNEQADRLINQSDELGRVVSGLINSLKKSKDEGS